VSGWGGCKREARTVQALKQAPKRPYFCAWNDRRTNTKDAAQLATSFVSGWWEVENFPEHVECANTGAHSTCLGAGTFGVAGKVRICQ